MDAPLLAAQHGHDPPRLSTQRAPLIERGSASFSEVIPPDASPLIEGLEPLGKRQLLLLSEKAAPTQKPPRG
jgi:hypothetical protein